MSAALRRHTDLLLLLSVALLAWSLHAGVLRVPDRWNPWAPLRLDDMPNLLTRFKLDRASSDPAACRAVLAQADWMLQPVADRRTGPGCGFENAVRVVHTDVAVGQPFALSCRAALSLAMWQRHALQQAARTHMGSEVVSIEHAGSYACRNLYGREGGRRSQHATADALDISGFVLADGRRVRVLGDWQASATPARADPGPDPGNAARAAFLRAVRDGACDHFDAVLGPEYNAAHADHFHFDRGRARICR